MTETAHEISGLARSIRPDALSLRSSLTQLAAFINHPTLVASAVFLLSGAAFAIGNLLLARTMSVAAFGQFAFALALFNIFILIMPLGIDQFLVRHRLEPDRRAISAVCFIACMGSGGLCTGLVVLRILPFATGVALGIAILSGALTVTANAALRSIGRTWWGLAFTTGASWLLLAIGGTALFWPPRDATGPLVVFAGGNVVMAIVAVTLALEARTGSRPIPINWREALSLLGIAAIGALALQVERLLVPATLGLTEMAVLAVLTSTAIFPYRLLVAGTGFSLVPRLRRASDAAERRHIAYREVRSAVGMTLLATLIILIVTPIVVPWLTNGVYRIGYLLTGAACLNGVSKLAHAMATAIITGCGDRRAVTHLNRLSFAWLAAACAGGWAGAHYGLIGLLIGVSSGGLIISFVTICLAQRLLNV